MMMRHNAKLSVCLRLFRDTTFTPFFTQQSIPVYNRVVQTLYGRTKWAGMPAARDHLTA
jgi:hypothetical protein